VKLLHFADLHLDAPFLWAGRSAAERRRQALRETLLAILALAQRLRVDALLCAGDLYEQDRFTPDTAQFLRSAFERAAPLRILVAPGNHDWLGPRSLYSLVRWSPNVRIFRQTALEPETLADGLTVWGAAHVAPVGTRGFLDGFRVDRGGVHLALFHGSERSHVQWAAGSHDPFAPFTQPQIAQAGLHHALVGHYHTPVDADRLTYPGNPEPLTFGETGERAAVLVTVRPDGYVQTERHVVARTAVHDITVDVTGCVSSQDVRDRLLEALAGLSGCVRATLCGEVGPDADIQPEALARVASGLDAFVVRVADLRHTYDLDAILREATIRGQFARDVERADLPDNDRRRVLDMGLRALAGRRDLELS
jgi:DNA repair exonuclease SbcCD nuclease subunit